MTKEAQLYCDATNAVDSGQYLKACSCKLRKYKKALRNIPPDVDQSPASYERLERLRNNLNNEIERRKTVFRSVVNKILIGVIIGLIVLATTIFANKFFIPKVPQSQSPQQQQGVYKK